MSATCAAVGLPARACTYTTSEPDAPCCQSHVVDQVLPSTCRGRRAPSCRTHVVDQVPQVARHV
eukprot:7948602-Alexandrium_andersonii.AAC.1